MRYNTPIYFIKYGKSEYDYDTGDYIEGEPTITCRNANVTETSDDNIAIEPGKVPEANVIIRLQHKFTEPYDVIKIGEKLYQTNSTTDYMFKQTIRAYEVQ